MKDGDCRPQEVVEVFPVTLASRIFADNLWTRALSTTIAVLVCELAKLTAKQVHPKYAVNIQHKTQ